MTATPAAPARMHAPAFDGVDAADRDDRRRDRGADARELVEPERRVGVVLRRRLPDRPDAEVVGVRLDRLLEGRRPSGRAAAPRPARAPRPRRTGRDARRRRRARAPRRRRRSRRTSRRARRSRCPRATTSAVGAFTRSCTTVAPAVDRARAPSRGRRRSRAPSRDLRARVERLRVERGERVVEPDVERARPLRVARGVLARDAEGDERLGRAARAARRRRRGSSRSSRSTCSRCP